MPADPVCGERVCEAISRNRRQRKDVEMKRMLMLLLLVPMLVVGLPSSVLSSSTIDDQGEFVSVEILESSGCSFEPVYGPAAVNGDPSEFEGDPVVAVLENGNGTAQANVQARVDETRSELVFYIDAAFSGGYVDWPAWLDSGEEEFYLTANGSKVKLVAIMPVGLNEETGLADGVEMGFESPDWPFEAYLHILTWKDGEQQTAATDFCDPTAVTLVSFTVGATETGLNSEWVTATEIDNLGFNILRSNEPDGEYDQLNSELIPSKALGSPEGASYEWLDDSVEFGVVYYYKLEAVDIYGKSDFYGPVEGRLLTHVFLPMIFAR